MTVCAAIGLALFDCLAQGQIVLDGSLGTSGAIAGPNFSVPASLGKTVRNNLFHSFSQFNLATGEIATFSGPNNIHNVLVRVTGGQASSIDGTIQCTIPGANFFLINPFGIMFGPNAHVNVSGSFVATTADHVGLAGGGRFDARNPANDLLTTAAPDAFGFLGPTAAPISINGTALVMSEGKVLSLIGGDIEITGSQISIPGGRLTLISTASAGELELPADDLLFNPSTTGFGQLGTIRISDFSVVDVSGSQGGRVTMIANDVIVEGGSVIGAETTGSGDGLGVSILARELIEIDGSSISSLASDMGAGGIIELTAPTVRLDGGDSGAALSTDTLGGTGRAGDIVIAANNLEITDNTQVSVASNGPGDGGNIQIVVSSLQLDGNGSFAGISANTFAGGKAGTVSITADSIDMRNAANISSSALFLGSSAGGDILIKTRALTIGNDASISASTATDGMGGNIQITASSISLDGLNSVGTDPVGIVAESQAGSTGRGGDIHITTDTLAVRNGAVISASSESDGDGGNVEIQAGSVVVENAGLIGSSAMSAGKGGSVILTVDGTLLVRDNGNLGVLASQGDAGDISVTAGSAIRVLDGQITAQAVGDGGNITLSSPSVVYLLDSKINAEADHGHGGNITIDPQFVILNGSQISANAQIGNGGNITIVSKFFLQSASSVTATAPFGVPGTVSITAPDVNLSGSLAPLNAELLDAESQLRPQCAVRLPLGLSSFVVAGRGGVPVEPDGLLPAFGVENIADEE
jgi:filamentous hemagglutinin family protein